MMCVNAYTVITSGPTDLILSFTVIRVVLGESARNTIFNAMILDKNVEDSEKSLLEAAQFFSSHQSLLEQEASM